MLLENYKILNPIKEGTVIIGYRLINQRSQVVTKPRDEVLELALLGYITNAKARIENGVITLKGIGCKLRDLPALQIKKIDTPELYVLTHRIISNRKIIGYIIQNNKGATRKISVDEGIELARNKRIHNVSIQKYGDSDYRLRGKNGFSLETLPTVSVKSTPVRKQTLTII